MTDLSLATAQTLVGRALEVARERGFKPMAVVVLDARGSLKAAASEDGCPIVRWQVALGKANVCVKFGAGGRRIDAIARERPHFFVGLGTVIGDAGAVPVPGGVLIQGDGGLVGAVGVSGDTSDNDEICAVAGIEAAGLKAAVG